MLNLQQMPALVAILLLATNSSWAQQPPASEVPPASPAPAAEVATPPVPTIATEEIEDERQRAERKLSDLKVELEQAEAEIDKVRDELEELEMRLQAGDITPNMLEQARLDVAARRSRNNSLKTRLLSRHEAFRQLRGDDFALRKQLRLAQQVGDEAKVASLQQQLNVQLALEQELAEIIDLLERLQRRANTQVSQAKQKLALLQDRFQLPNLNAPSRPPNAQQQQLRRNIDKELTKASKYRQQAANTSADSNAELAKKRLLELQAVNSEERSEFMQSELKLLRALQVLNTLDAFARTPSTPVRVLKHGDKNLNALISEIETEATVAERKKAIFQDQGLIISQQGQIAEGKDSTQAERLKLLEGLKTLAAKHAEAVKSTLERANSSAKIYQKAIADSSHDELLQRREFPTDAFGWRTLGVSALHLPARIVAAAREAVNSFATALSVQSTGRLLTVIAALLGLVGLAFFARRALGRYLQKEEANDDSNALMPLEVLQQNIHWLLPPALLVLGGWLLEIQWRHIFLVATPLFIWPAVRITLQIATDLLDTYTPNLDRAQTQSLLREARWIVILVAVFAAAITIAKTISLSPQLDSAIAGASMLCLLLIAIPLLHLRRLVIAAQDSAPSGLILRWLSLLVPLVLIVSAAIGICGYINLAWSIAEHMGWAIGIGLLFLFGRNALRDGVNRADRHFHNKDPDSSAFMRQAVLAPVYGVLVLVLLAACGWLLYVALGWNPDTPLISSVPKLLDYTLFKVGSSGIQVSNLVIAAILVFFIFRAASWSKEVSFRWAFRRIQDVGIRNSLATFTQYIVVVLGLMIAIRTIGLDLTALTVFAGALGVGLGFGMQQIVVNFISGILLLVERPLSTTDLVNIDRYEGEVTRIGIRSLTVKTFDSQEVIIPNSAVITKPFTNWTRSDDVMRTVLMVGIGYDDDPHEAIKIIDKVVREHHATLTDPGPKILLWDYADSALMIRVQLFTRIRGPVGRPDVRSQLLLQIWDALQEAGITIPYPQRDVHLHGTAPASPLPPPSETQ